MNILLDTCTYIWFRTEPNKLSKKAIELINDKENTFYISAVSLWEINLKVKIGKLKVKGQLEKLTDVQKDEDIFKPAGFETKDSEQLTKIILHNKDPFDLMLICQALANSFAILTPDPHIKNYPVKTLW